MWAVLTLSTAGDLVDDGVRLRMGRSYLGEVVFTPDASLALTPTEDGHVAVYDAVGGNVVHEEYDGGFYAVRVVMDPSGEVAWIIDGNWAKNGGGLWRVDIDCLRGRRGHRA